MGKVATVQGKNWHCHLCNQDCVGQMGFGSHKHGQKHQERYQYLTEHPELDAAQVRAIFDAPQADSSPAGQTTIEKFNRSDHC